MRTNLRVDRRRRALFQSVRPIVFACALLITGGALAISASSRQATSRLPASGRVDAFETTVKPFLKTYCYGCHSGDQPAAGFDLKSYDDQQSVIRDQRRWNLVLARLKAGEMPPSQSRQHPTAEQRQSVIDSIETISAE